MAAASLRGGASHIQRRLHLVPSTRGLLDGLLDDLLDGLLDGLLDALQDALLDALLDAPVYTCSRLHLVLSVVPCLHVLPSTRAPVYTCSRL